MDRIRSIERRALVLIGAATLLCALFLGSWAVTLGVAVGGFLELLNFFVLGRLIEKIIDSRSPEKAALIASALVLKFVWLGLSIYLCLRYLPIDGAAFTSGIVLVVIAIISEAFYPSHKKR